MFLSVCIVWLVLSFIVGSMGRNRSVEFSGAFAVSLLLSPIAGLVLVLLSSEIDDKAALALATGEQQIRKKKYDKALQAFHAALKERPHSVTAHYSLARTYSLKNMPKDSLYHLNKAFENGYFNFYRVQSSPDLLNLRSSEEYKAFEPNSYMLGRFLSAPKDKLVLRVS